MNKPPLGNTTTSVFVDNRTNLQPTRTLDEKEFEKLSAIELEHYKRVQRIMNSGPKVNNIFGVNNYNPENSFNAGDGNSLFSPKKNIGNMPTSNNKIDKTIKIGNRQNHNFVSVINKTKYVPVKKKDKDKNNKTKDKNEIKTEEKKENENDIDNKIAYESISPKTNE